jgi:hypothetical protein
VYARDPAMSSTIMTVYVGDQFHYSLLSSQDKLMLV